MGKMIEVPFGGKTIPAYLAPPSGEIKGGLILIHEVWGLVDHIKVVADRFAAEGYVVVAPDLLSETDIAAHVGTLNIDLFDPEKRSEAQPKMRELTAPMKSPEFGHETVAKLKSLFEYVYGHAEVKQNVMVCGFCFGGTYSYALVVNEPRLKAAVTFYGHASEDINELKQIKCPILAFYGEKDQDLVNALPELKENMKAANVDFEAVVYPNCGHAFFNDTNKFTYNEPAAHDAWHRTLAFFEKQLL
jgi:carboxymethylenebutenolidase